MWGAREPPCRVLTGIDPCAGENRPHLLQRPRLLQPSATLTIAADGKVMVSILLPLNMVKRELEILRRN
jgi:hypothetical protein